MKNNLGIVDVAVKNQKRLQCCRSKDFWTDFALGSKFDGTALVQKQHHKGTGFLTFNLATLQNLGEFLSLLVVIARK